jgi:3-deoxy-D-manno-octulosonate 8-phosphate phosphatase (KDO 8-P phosphatase)
MNKLISRNNFDLFVYDFDGVMTDNRVIVLENGLEGIIANRADGLGVGLIKKTGIDQLIISTEANPVVLGRANKLKITCIHGCADKKTALINYCKDNGIELGRVLFVGNDINDLAAMEIVGLRVAPKDAHPKIIYQADIVTESKGGEGVIRELFDLIES